MSNPLLSPEENATLEEMRSTNAHRWQRLAQARDAAMEAAPTMFPSLANIARDPWHEIVFTIALALAGGALVGGILVPVAYEVIEGRFNGVPYTLWGISLWLACAGWLRRRKWLPFVWFVTVLLIISSWV